MNRQKLLIVDDELVNIKLLKAMLSKGGYEFLETTKGHDAFEIVSQAQPDLVLLDVMMPEVSGYDVCRQIKAEESTKSIPVLMVTALQERENRLIAMEAGADDFLNKPVDPTELTIRVKSLLRIKTYHDRLYQNVLDLAEKNQRLQELEKTKEGLTHMIIHDLNHPLTVISFILQLLPSEIEGSKAKTLQYVKKCLTHCEELEEMIQGLLDIYRMEEGALRLEKEATDADELIQEEWGRCQARVPSNDISFRFSKGNEPVQIEIDRRLIRRVFSNLIGNAIRHTPAGGEIQVFWESENGKITFNVKDNGIGLAPEYHEKIFEKFEQVDLKKAGVQIGSTGLGLAFCKLAIEAHSGQIWVESEGKGKGCVFRFSLPGSRFESGCADQGVRTNGNNENNEIMRSAAC